jgi:tetratricopeptide (TPR) repeat protein
VEVTKTRREGVARGFFWGILVSLLLMTGYALVAGGSDKPESKDHGQADLQQQVSQYRAALVKNPEDINTMIALGDIYLNSNNVRDAYQIFLQAVKVEPNNTHVLNDLGSIYQQIARYDEAINSYQKAYNSDPRHSSSLLNMALIYSQHKKEYPKALELLQSFLAGSPEPQLATKAEQEVARIKRIMKNGNDASSSN